MELDVVEAFELTDYTTATEWERFVVALEGIMRKWMRAVPETGIVSETLEYARKRVFIRYHHGGPCSVLDLVESSADFSSLVHPLSRWFGFSSFVTIEEDSVVDLAEARLLLSSLILACEAVPLSVPFFVPFGRSRPRDYVGYMVTRDAVARFSAISSFVRVPPSLLSLSNSLSSVDNDVSVCAHCTWRFPMNAHSGWQTPLHLAPGSYHRETSWGPDLDPVASIGYATTTQLQGPLHDDDNSHQNPLADPSAHWSIFCELDPSPETPMSESIRMLAEALSASEGFRSVRDILNDQQPFSRALLDPALLPTADELAAMIAELFSADHVACRFQQKQQELDVKSAPPLSLLASLCMYFLNAEGLPAVALVWQEFVKELRFHWDRNKELPRTGYPSGEPHLFCKTFQRLQMLNWCIKQRHERKESAKKAALGGWASVDFDSVSSGDEESGKEEEEEEEEQEQKKQDGPKREGVRSELKLKLLVSGITMCVPVTQDVLVATTEDILEEQQALLMSLGDDKQGSEMRAEIQSQGLLSDMQAFRAANPGAILPDFVRWHSERDWIVSDAQDKEVGKQDDGSWVYLDHVSGKKVQGRLSGRMGEAGNLWERLWNKSEPIPVERQKPLVDYTREGERVLNMFEQMDPESLLRECILVALTSVWHTFSLQPAAEVPVVSRQISSFAASLIELGGGRNAGIEFGSEDLEVCMAELGTLERVCACATSLLTKLGSSQELVNSLLKDSKGGVHVVLDSEDKKYVVTRFLQNYTWPLPPPNEREYILRSFSGSQKLPQRVYAFMGDDSLVRICRADTEEKQT